MGRPAALGQGEQRGTGRYAVVEIDGNEQVRQERLA
jgi:hypothetical protein